MRTLLRFLLICSLIGTAGTATAADRASCTPDFTSCSIPENVLLQLPFGAFAGDVIIQDQGSTSLIDVFRIFNNIVDTGGGTGLGNLAILYSGDDNNQLPDPSTYSANAVVITGAASGATLFTGNGTTYHLDTSAAATRLVYTGDHAINYHHAVQLRARLMVRGSRAPVPDATVQFTLGSQACNGTTDASGAVKCSVVINQPPGSYMVTAAFSGIFGVDAGTSISRPVSVTREETTLSYTGDTVIEQGGTAHLSGVLLEDRVTPIAGRTVTFTLRAHRDPEGTGASSGEIAQACSGITDDSGTAECTITPVTQPLGPGVVSGKFAGDTFYRPTSARARTVVVASPAEAPSSAGTSARR